MIKQPIIRVFNLYPAMVVSIEGDLSIYLNEKKLKNFEFEQEAKRLIGFRFRHQGSGWLKNVSLNDVVLN